MNTTKRISIAIETSCRVGAVALGRGDQLIATAELGHSGKHAARLLPALEELLSANGITPAELSEVYISVGPGSFTGLRVGITVARTLGQMLPDAKLIAVPTELAIAQNVADLPWQNLGVLLAAKNDTVHASLITRDENNLPVNAGESQVAALQDVIASWPADTLLTGEGIGYCSQELPAGHKAVGEDLWFPKVESVWKIGQKLAAEEKFTPYNELLPVYSRKPEAVRLWEKRHGKQ